MRLSALSLKYRIALVIFLLEGVMVSIVLWQTLSISNRSAYELQLANENVLLDLVQEVASTALLTEEYTDLQLYLAKLVQQPTVERILVSDINQRVIASSQSADIGKPLPEMIPGEKVFWRSTTVSSPAGDLGALAVRFSTQVLDEAIEQARNRGITLAVIGMTMIAVVGILVGFALTRRLDKVAYAAQRFTGGDRAARSGISGQDEIGNLGLTFDTMVEEVSRHQNELEQRVLERTAKLQEQATIIDQVHDSVVATDLDGVVVSWNRGAERLFGYSASEAIGRHISFVYPADKHEFLRDEVIAPLQKKGSHEIEVTMLRKDGSAFCAHLSLSLLYNEQREPRGMVGFTLDITDRKRQENMLQELSSQLSAANQELEAFSYSVSHDLRAPLRAIDGFSRALEEDYGEQLDSVATGYLNRVRHGAQYMAQLIDDLLQLSRVSRRDMESKPFDITAAARDIVQVLQEGDADRDVEIEIQDGLKAWGDPVLLRVVLDNLLGNAWKYTGNEEKAKISLLRVENPDGDAFVVRDNGAGFDMRYADKLFGAFQRLHHSDEFPGTGVGLATVFRVLQRHGGEVRAESKVGEGASFYVSLPRPK